MAELTSLTIAQARQGLAKKDFTAVELADAHLAAMERTRTLNAYVLETPERALAMAKAADARLLKGDMGPPACWLSSDEAATYTGNRIIAANWDTTLPGGQAAARAGRAIGWPELGADAVWLQGKP